MANAVHKQKQSHAPPVTGAGRDAFFDDLIADPEKYRKKWAEELHREQPHLTQAQIDAAWEQLAHQFGL